MKNISSLKQLIVMNLTLAASLLFLSSCGVIGAGSCVGECASKDAGRDADDDGRINLNRQMVYTVDDDFLGYAMGYHLDYLKIYIPAYDQHVIIHPVNGEYMKYPRAANEEIYFDDLGCTGNAVIIGWAGKVGNTYIVSRDNRTFKIQSTTFYNINNRFMAKSKLTSNRPDTEPCSDSNTTIQNYAANLVETDSLVDLTPYAPFQMFTTEE